MDGDGFIAALAHSAEDDTVAWDEDDGSAGFTKHPIATDFLFPIDFMGWRYGRVITALFTSSKSTYPTHFRYVSESKHHHYV